MIYFKMYLMYCIVQVINKLNNQCKSLTPVLAHADPHCRRWCLGAPESSYRRPVWLGLCAAVAPGKDFAPTIEYWTAAADRSSRLQHLLRCSSEPADDTCISSRPDVDCIWGRYLDRPDTQA